MRTRFLPDVLGAAALVGLGGAAASGCAHPRTAAPLPIEQPADHGAELIGTTPAPWEVSRWLNSPPLTLASLRGKVVLARWWTADCPYCSATAPSLRDFAAEYGERGLVVVGMYHHKGDGPLDEVAVERTARAYGFTFPVAIDADWRTLDRWWQPRAKARAFTSVSFVLDRRGVVRHVHPGGAYAKGTPAHAEMRRILVALLDEASTADRTPGMHSDSVTEEPPREGVAQVPRGERRR